MLASHVQVNPASISHVDEHPSQETLLSSSHISYGVSISPSPQQVNVSATIASIYTLPHQRTLYDLFTKRT